MGLAPAFGLATTTLAAAPVANLGPPFSSITAWAIYLATALAGWVVFASVALVRRRRDAQAEAPTAAVEPAVATDPGPAVRSATESDPQ